MSKDSKYYVQAFHYYNPEIGLDVKKARVWSHEQYLEYCKNHKKEDLDRYGQLVDKLPDEKEYEIEYMFDEQKNTGSNK